MAQIYGRMFGKETLSRSHLKVIELVGFNKSVLELGSSTGYITRFLKQNGCKIDIVEIDRDDFKKAKVYAAKGYLGSLEDEKLLGKLKDKYEIILAMDILEHLKNPESLLKKLKKNLNKKGRIIISLPNIACWEIRRDLFFKGKFEYQPSGILDQTHLRFYTYESAQELILKSGYKILQLIKMEYSYPLRRFILRFRSLGMVLDNMIVNLGIKNFPNFFTQHLIIEAS